MTNIENLNVDASTKANVMTWLNGSYDEETKQAIRDMVDNNPNELNESLALAACVASWVWAPTA